MTEHHHQFWPGRRALAGISKYEMAWRNRVLFILIFSDYSMTDQPLKPTAGQKVASMNMPAMAITDFTNLCGLFVNLRQCARRRGETDCRRGFPDETKLLGDEPAAHDLDSGTQ